MANSNTFIVEDIASTLNASSLHGSIRKERPLLEAPWWRVGFHAKFQQLPSSGVVLLKHFPAAFRESSKHDQAHGSMAVALERCGGGLKLNWDAPRYVGLVGPLPPDTITYRVQSPNNPQSCDLESATDFEQPVQEAPSRWDSRTASSRCHWLGALSRPASATAWLKFFGMRSAFGVDVGMVTLLLPF